MQRWTTAFLRASRAAATASAPARPPSPPKAAGVKDGSLLGALTSGASLLCALHCTVLPAVMAAAPLLAGAGALADAAHSAAVESTLHALTLYFVLPVGALSAALNLRATRRAGPALISAFGLVAIAATSGVVPEATAFLNGLNGGDADHPSCGCDGEAHEHEHTATATGGGAAAALFSPMAIAKLSGPVLLIGGQLWSRRIAAAAAASQTAAKSCCASKSATAKVA